MVNGWLYDPKDGNTYNITAELTSSSIITARVYADPYARPHRNLIPRSAASC